MKHMWTEWVTGMESDVFFLVRNKLSQLVSPGIFLWGDISQAVWRTEVPIEVQGRSPDRGLGNEFPQKLKYIVCRHCLQILTAEMISVWKFCTI